MTAIDRIMIMLVLCRPCKGTGMRESRLIPGARGPYTGPPFPKEPFLLSCGFCMGRGYGVILRAVKEAHDD